MRELHCTIRASVLYTAIKMYTRKHSMICMISFQLVPVDATARNIGAKKKKKKKRNKYYSSRCIIRRFDKESPSFYRMHTLASNVCEKERKSP